jgi:hypothetical protein
VLGWKLSEHRSTKDEADAAALKVAKRRIREALHQG